MRTSNSPLPDKTNELGEKFDRLLRQAQESYREVDDPVEVASNVSVLHNPALQSIADTILERLIRHLHIPPEGVKKPQMLVTSKALDLGGRSMGACLDEGRYISLDKVFLFDEPERLGSSLTEEIVHSLDSQVGAERPSTMTPLQKNIHLEAIAFAGRKLVWSMLQESPDYTHSKIFPPEQISFSPKWRAYIRSVIEANKPSRTRQRALHFFNRTLRWAAPLVRPFLDRGRAKREFSLIHHRGYALGDRMTTDELRAHFAQKQAE